MCVSVYMYTYFWWPRVDGSAFEGRVTFSSLFILDLVGKDFHLWIAARALAKWGIGSRVLGRVQWRGLCAVS